MAAAEHFRNTLPSFLSAVDGLALYVLLLPELLPVRTLFAASASVFIVQHLLRKKSGENPFLPESL